MDILRIEVNNNVKSSIVKNAKNEYRIAFHKAWIYETDINIVKSIAQKAYDDVINNQIEYDDDECFDPVPKTAMKKAKEIQALCKNVEENRTKITELQKRLKVYLREWACAY